MNRRRNFFVLSAILVISLSVTTVALAQNRIADAVYQKWLNEDVAYIITPQERSDFLRLSNKDDRYNFVVQFWLRRDPTPGTPENEFKEEHYRRLAYANQHFANSHAGWQTDRGRIYVLHGPPDEIQSITPAPGDTLGHVGQIWRYRSGKQFRFMDECNCGEYKLVDER